MRMSTAWAKLVIENMGLKSALICLTVVCMGLSVLLFEANSKEPLVIERSCYSKALTSSGHQQTRDEVDSFMRLALSQRFDSDLKVNELIDIEIQKLKLKEQEELNSRQMRQFVHMNSWTGENGSYTVDADRVIAAGNIRSALKFPLKVKLIAVQRTSLNPYGLLLADVEQIKESKDEK